MRKLILEVQVSIDGFIAETNGNTDWMVWNWGADWKWDKELQNYHTDLTKSADCILLSRQMAEEGFIAHWAKAAENPEDPRFEFAKHITDSHKIVFSNTINRSASIPGGWENVEIAEGDFKDVIKSLKKKNGKDMLVYGGSTFVSSLISTNLIDEFHLLVNPVALGGGLPIFNGLTSKQTMTLVNSRGFDCGMVLLHYLL